MLDVVHFMLEDDLNKHSTGEGMEAASEVRTSIYRSIYNREYEYAISKSGRSASGSMTYADGSIVGSPEDDLSDISAFDPNPVKKSSKPYIPPTKFNPDSNLPFGKDLDAPLG